MCGPLFDYVHSNFTARPFRGMKYISKSTWSKADVCGLSTLWDHVKVMSQVSTFWDHDRTWFGPCWDCVCPKFGLYQP